MADQEPTNWLYGALGKVGAPEPPALDSNRIKDLIARTLMHPDKIRPQEVQELAASALSHLVALKKA